MTLVTVCSPCDGFIGDALPPVDTLGNIDFQPNRLSQIWPINQLELLARMGHEQFSTRWPGY